MMLTLQQAAAMIANARVVGDAATVFNQVSTDSRRAGPGDLFIALRGERFDAHDFLPALPPQQVSAALVSRVPDLFALPHIVVPDTLRALGELARGWRRRWVAHHDVMSRPLVAVTGSNGKTTVKEMIASIFTTAVGAEATLATRGNLNNDIGLPLTLLRLRTAHRLAVIELGMNHPDETPYLAGICEPTIALVNNAQREHQEFMQTVEAVALEHAAVIHALPANGTAIYPADEKYTPIWRVAAHRRPIIDFALADDGTDLTAIDAAVAGQWRDGRLHVRTPAGTFDVALQTQGRHNLRNALAATAAAVAARVALSDIAAGLSAFEPVKGRLQVKRAVVGALSGATVIDDSYNANPDSMRAAIDVLVQAGAPRVLVVGDMGEVGDQETAAHREIGEYARVCGIDGFYALGQASRHACEAFGAAAQHFDSPEALVAALQASPFAQVPAPVRPTVLVKGSRFMAMERVVEALVKSTVKGANGAQTA